MVGLQGGAFSLYHLRSFFRAIKHVCLPLWPSLVSVSLLGLRTRLRLCARASVLLLTGIFCLAPLYTNNPLTSFIALVLDDYQINLYESGNPIHSCNCLCTPSFSQSEAEYNYVTENRLSFDMAWPDYRVGMPFHAACIQVGAAPCHASYLALAESEDLSLYNGQPNLFIVQGQIQSRHTANHDIDLDEGRSKSKQSISL